MKTLRDDAARKIALSDCTVSVWQRYGRVRRDLKIRGSCVFTQLRTIGDGNERLFERGASLLSHARVVRDDIEYEFEERAEDCTRVIEASPTILAKQQRLQACVLIERNDDERFIFSDLGNRVYRWQAYECSIDANYRLRTHNSPCSIPSSTVKPTSVSRKGMIGQECLCPNVRASIFQSYRHTDDIRTPTTDAPTFIG